MPAVARIHYEIPDDLHRRAKAAAALEGVTLKGFVIAALEAAVGAPDAAGEGGGDGRSSR